MDAKFLIRDYEIDIIPEIKYSDYMDGTPDTMAFSFKTDENLSEIINIKEAEMRCAVLSQRCITKKALKDGAAVTI